MKPKKILYGVLLSSLLLSCATAQQCTLQVIWKIIDHHEDHPLEFATLFIEESNKAFVSDSSGSIQVQGLCPGYYHIAIQHFGCETVRQYIEILQDTSYTVFMEHHSYALDPVLIKDSNAKQPGANRQVMQAGVLRHQLDRPIASILESIAGVSAKKNGANISSPIIQGLSGNRINLLHAGVLHAGQQWGADHAPEIDPFSAQHITVVKGVDAIPYGGNGLGGLVLMEPGTISKDPHLHGAAQAILRSNGNSVHLGFKLEQAKNKWEWRWVCSGKISGDHKSPDYYLTNTGSRNLSTSILANYSAGFKKHIKFYYAYFHTEPGILRGSHIGNLTDLQEAIGRDKPFFTKDNFSYAIEAPKQKVQHHFLKCSYQAEKQQLFTDYTLAFQWNNRQEFDIRRSGRSEIPSLDLHLATGHLQLNHQITGNRRKISFGISSQLQLNTSNKGTGIIALIPDYTAINPGAYAKALFESPRLRLDIGGRYDFHVLNVDYIRRGTSLTIEKLQRSFHNMSIATGLEWILTESFQIDMNGGWTQRAPHVNELYSNGLHQSVAGIEEGDPKLNQEASLKFQMTAKLLLNQWLNFECAVWHQNINDFIFLEPQKEPRLTIRGAFPVFLYKQTDARLFGLDIQGKFEWAPHWQLDAKASYVRAEDRSHQPITGIPPTQINSTLHYLLHRQGQVRRWDFFISPAYHFKQTHYAIESDLLDPPPAYFIMSAGIEVEAFLIKKHWYSGIIVENIFNKRYRDYLNRLRYYADEEGLGAHIYLRVEF